MTVKKKNGLGFSLGYVTSKDCHPEHKNQTSPEVPIYAYF